MTLNQKLLFAGCAAILLAACVKDELYLDQLEYNINPEFGIRLANAKLDMSDLISHFDENGIVEDSAGVLSIVYQGNIADIRALDVIAIPDQQLSLNTSLSAEETEYLALHDSVVVERFFDVDFTLENGSDILDSLQIHTAILHLSSQTPVANKGEIAILNPATNQPVWSGAFQDLQAPYGLEQDYELNNTTLHYAVGSSGASQLRAYYRITLIASEGGAVSQLQVKVSLNDINYKGIYGQLQPRSVSVSESAINLDLFNSDFVGTFNVADPSLKFFVSNSFGVEAEFDLPELSGYRDDVQLFQLANPYENILPVIPAAPVPYVASDLNFTIYSNSSNPSLSELMLQKPQELHANVQANLATASGTQAFVMDSSKLKIDMEARFPLYGYINDFQFVDTTEADLSGITGQQDDRSDLESATIRLKIANRLPIDVQVQIVFLDSTFNELDSLFQQQQPAVQSAPVNFSVAPDHLDYGRTTGTTEATTDIVLNREKLDKIAATSQIIVRVTGSTFGNQPQNIRIFASDNVEVFLSAKARFHITNQD